MVSVLRAVWESASPDMGVDCPDFAVIGSSPNRLRGVARTEGGTEFDAWRHRAHQGGSDLAEDRTCPPLTAGLGNVEDKSTVSGECASLEASILGLEMTADRACDRREKVLVIRLPGT